MKSEKGTGRDAQSRQSLKSPPVQLQRGASRSNFGGNSARKSRLGKILSNVETQYLGFGNRSNFQSQLLVCLVGLEV